MTPLAAGCFAALMLLCRVSAAADSGPSLSHDWDAMTEQEKYCVVPSHQVEAACRWAGPSADEVLKAYRYRHYDKALAGFAAAARAGHTWGMWGEGAMQWFGYGVEPNRARAYGLVKAAAELGDMTADGLADQMAREMTGVELLRSERTTEEYLSLGSASDLTFRRWAAEQLGIAVGASGPAPTAGSCSGQVPTLGPVPKIAKNAKRKMPQYAISWREEGRSADVYVAALVDVTGKVCRSQVIDTLYGTDRMGRDSVDAVQAWMFDPPKLDGRPVESMYLVKFSYRIRN